MSIHLIRNTSLDTKRRIVTSQKKSWENDKITQIIKDYMVFIFLESSSGIRLGCCLLLYLENFLSTNVDNRGSQKILVCSNSTTLQCYRTTIWQFLVLNSASWNDRGFFKFHYAIAAIWQHYFVLILKVSAISPKCLLMHLWY